MTPASDSNMWVPTTIDTGSPNIARMYDYYLGGKDNFAVDREAADQVIGRFPDTRLVARQNRAVMRRGAQAMAHAGIRQFVDAGSGLPTQYNLHQVVQRAAPEARVVYVDNDPIVLAHARALLDANSRTTVITADLRDPDKLFSEPRLLDLIDFDEPLGLMMVAVLHFIPDADDPDSIIAGYRERMAPGSQLMITHVTDTETDEDAAAAAVEAYRPASSPLVFRRPQRIRGFLDGLELLDPGLVPTWEWRPDGTRDRATSPRILAGLGRIPT